MERFLRSKNNVCEACCSVSTIKRGGLLEVPPLFISQKLEVSQSRKITSRWMVNSSKMPTLTSSSFPNEPASSYFPLSFSMNTSSVSFAGATIQYSRTPACSYNLYFSHLSYLAVACERISTIKSGVSLHPLSSSFSGLHTMVMSGCTTFQFSMSHLYKVSIANVGRESCPCSKPIHPPLFLRLQEGVFLADRIKVLLRYEIAYLNGEATVYIIETIYIYRENRRIR